MEFVRLVIIDYRDAIAKRRFLDATDCGGPRGVVYDDNLDRESIGDGRKSLERCKAGLRPEP